MDDANMYMALHTNGHELQGGMPPHVGNGHELQELPQLPQPDQAHDDAGHMMKGDAPYLTPPPLQPEMMVTGHMDPSGAVHGGVPETENLHEEVAKLRSQVSLLIWEVSNLKRVLSLPTLPSLPPMPLGDPSAIESMMQGVYADANKRAEEMAAMGSERGAAEGLHALHAAAALSYGGQLHLPSAQETSYIEKTSTVKRARVESLQLEMDEQEVINELRARGLITENPEEGEDMRKGGRPPLGMGALKRVKDMYDKRQITMDGWRRYYQEKCHESGFDAKPNQPQKRQKFPHSGGHDHGARQAIPYQFPAFTEDTPLNENEVRLVRNLCGELTYSQETPPEEKFVWNKADTDARNFEELRLFLLRHRPSKNRRGKKPTAIEHFPMVFDLWAASFIESSQFRRICKYSNISVDQLQEEMQEEMEVRGFPSGSLAQPPQHLPTAAQQLVDHHHENSQLEMPASAALESSGSMLPPAAP